VDRLSLSTNITFVYGLERNNRHISYIGGIISDQFFLDQVEIIIFVRYYVDQFILVVTYQLDFLGFVALVVRPLLLDGIVWACWCHQVQNCFD